jgi:hypothetical protein
MPLVVFNDNWITVSIAISIAIFVDDDGLVPFSPISVRVDYYCLIAVMIAISANCYPSTSRANSNSDLFCGRRQNTAKAQGGARYESETTDHKKSPIVTGVDWMEFIAALATAPRMGLFLFVFLLTSTNDHNGE